MNTGYQSTNRPRSASANSAAKRPTWDRASQRVTTFHCAASQCGACHSRIEPDTTRPGRTAANARCSTGRCQAGGRARGRIPWPAERSATAPQDRVNERASARCRRFCDSYSSIPYRIPRLLVLSVGCDTQLAIQSVAGQMPRLIKPIYLQTITASISGITAFWRGESQYRELAPLSKLA